MPKRADPKGEAEADREGAAKPMFAPMDRWCAISGVSRMTSYRWLAAKHLRGKKAGRRLLIDVQHGLRYIRSLPDHKISIPNDRRPKPTATPATAT